MKDLICIHKLNLPFFSIGFFVLIINCLSFGSTSTPCTISHTISNLYCDDNGTPSDPTDDLFGFDLLITGSNTSSGWSANDPHNTAAFYGVITAFGPYLISDGNVVFTVIDDVDSTCTTAVEVVPPPTCSESCVIAAVVSNIICDDNGTPSDPTDDTFTFDVLVTGSNTSSSWSANDPFNTTSSYGVPVSFGPYLISAGPVTFIITDNMDSYCTAVVFVNPPPGCSFMCSINATVSNICCDDNGTPSDSTDDMVTFDLLITGNNTSFGWSANDSQNTVGTYDSTITFGPYLMSDGTVVFSVTDLIDSTCTTEVVVSLPVICSSCCSINSVVSNILCDDNGTPTDSTDDTFTFEVFVVGSNVSSEWTANDPGSTSGAYGASVSFGPYPISWGSISFSITDNDDQNCSDFVAVQPPPSCSGLSRQHNVDGISSLFNFYPNPVESTLNIEMIRTAQINIYNSSGKLVFQDRIQGISSLPIGNLSTGLYFINADLGGTKITRRFLKL